ncbi:MAG: vanadium-dependent haloperoxidase [Pseudomonadota bacterium]
MKTIAMSLLALIVLLPMAQPVAAKEPVIQAWSDLLFTVEESPVEDVNLLRLLAGMHLSMYYAGATLDPRYDLGTELPRADATADEAAMAAGRVYLSRYLDLDASALAPIEGYAARDDLQALANASAELAFDTVTATRGERSHYRPFVVPGRYVPTRIPGDTRTSNLPHFAYGHQLATQIPPPPGPDSAAYADSYNETQILGADDSTARTEDQAKASMIFDLQDPYPMIFRIMARRDLSIFEQARIMAIYDLGSEDMTAAQFAGKLHFQSWRPITAIRNGDIDGRADTELQADWTPLLETPNSSEYPCGHCTFVSGTAGILEVLLPLEDGEQVVILADDIFTTENNRGYDGDLVAYIEGHQMTFDAYDAFAEAGALSRIHNGAHFRFSTEAGLRLGRAVAAATIQVWDGLPDE